MAKKKRYTSSERTALISAHESSGLSIGEFCASHSLNVHTYKYWLRQHRKGIRQATTSISKEKNKFLKEGKFIAVGSLAPSTNESKLESKLELELGEAYRLLLPSDYCVDRLVDLLNGIS